MAINDTTIKDNVLLEQYWSFFQMQSSQRIQMVNFYITIETVLIGAYFTVLSINTPQWINCVVSLFVIVTSVAFYGLDRRTRQLIHWCNECILRLEGRYDNTYKKDELLLSYIISKRKKGLFTGTYTMWFNLFYFVIALFGLVSFVMTVVHIITCNA